MIRPFTAAIVFLAAIMCGEGAAFAQQASGGYPAVFGGASTESGTLNLLVDVNESYDNNLNADAGNITPSASPWSVSGAYTTLAPQIDFHTKGDRFQFSAIGSSNLRYYSNFDQVYAMSHSAAASMAAQLTATTSLSVSQSASYAPAFLYALFAAPSTGAVADLLPGGADYQATSERSYGYGTTASITHTIGPRASLSFNGSYHFTNFVGNVPGYFDLKSSDAGVRWTYGLDRNVKLRIGYTYRNTQISQSLRPVEHDLDIGVDYTKPLSRTRKSLIGISFGPTMLSGSLAPADPNAATTHYGLTGSAFYDRQVSRTWHVRADYHRGLSYIEGFAGPVYNDGATVGTSGFLNRRTDLSFSAAYAVGDMAAQFQSAQFRTYTGDARLRVALTHQWAAYVEGLLYEYNFDRALLLVPGMPNQLNRSVVRAGLTLWLPVRSR